MKGLVEISIDLSTHVNNFYITKFSEFYRIKDSNMKVESVKDAE